MLNWLDRSALAFTERVAALSVVGILAIGLVTVADVVLRVVLNSPINGLNEITQPLLALGVAACIPAGVMGRANISIEIAEPVVGKTVFAWLKVFGSVALLIFIFIIVARLWAMGDRMSQVGRTSSILSLPEGEMLKAVSVVLALAVPLQLIPIGQTIADAIAVNRRVAIVVSVFAVALGAAIAIFWAPLQNYMQPVFDLEPPYLALICFALIWVAVFLTVPIGAATGLAGLLGSAVLLGNGPSLMMFGTHIHDMLFNDSLAVLPLFLLMGSFATVAGLSGDIYRFAQAAVGHFRGGLAIATVLGSAGFGALTGSSIATSATIGKVSLPEMARRNYSRALGAGSVAAGGTLGQLVPPSTVIVVYALLTEESIGTLFIATIVPALLAVGLYIAAISITCAVRPGWGPAGPKSTAREVVTSLILGWQAFALIGIVIGGIYTGTFTETEAASVGAVGAVIFAVLRGKLRRDTVWQIMRETTTTIAMIYLLIFGAVNFSALIAISDVPALFIAVMTSITQEPILVVAMIAAIYLLLGTVMDSFAIMIITSPVFLPLILQFGMDPIWWGIVTICLVETGMITPPFGLNLFVLRSIDPNLGLKDVYRGVAPFIVADIIKIILLIAFPLITLWLPSTR